MNDPLEIAMIVIVCLGSIIAVITGFMLPLRDEGDESDHHLPRGS